MMGKPKTAQARRLRKNMTDAERLLWSALRNRRLEGYKFRRQAPLGPYIADFLCHHPPLVIELDGGQHSLQVEHDEKRTSVLEGQGFAVVRYWNNDVLANLDGVLEDILLHLRSVSQG